MGTRLKYGVFCSDILGIWYQKYDTPGETRGKTPKGHQQKTGEFLVMFERGKIVALSRRLNIS
jgi:hypothetical protein